MIGTLSSSSAPSKDAALQGKCPYGAGDQRLLGPRWARLPLDVERQQEFASITALADRNPAWPGNRLRQLRNSFFHYLRLDRDAANAGQLRLQRGLVEAADLEGRLIIEGAAPLNGIRSLSQTKSSSRAWRRITKRVSLSDSLLRLPIISPRSIGSLKQQSAGTCASFPTASFSSKRRKRRPSS
jgi:hypothetical protein